jgi:hypothetical protein
MVARDSVFLTRCSSNRPPRQSHFLSRTLRSPIIGSRIRLTLYYALQGIIFDKTGVCTSSSARFTTGFCPLRPMEGLRAWLTSIGIQVAGPKSKLTVVEKEIKEIIESEYDENVRA